MGSRIIWAYGGRCKKLRRAVAIIDETSSDIKRYDCLKCIGNNQQNNNKTRMCLLTGTRHIKYTKKNRLISIRNIGHFFAVLERIEKANPGIKLVTALRRIGAGVCAKSIPISKEVSWWLDFIEKCTGGESGMDILHLPFPGTILEQPDIFFQVRDILVAERSRLRNMRYGTDKTEKPGPKDRRRMESDE